MLLHSMKKTTYLFGMGILILFVSCTSEKVITFRGICVDAVSEINLLTTININ